jgi:site-specific DNA recombinase
MHELGCALTREFPLQIKRRGVEMKLVIDAPGPRATGPDPVLLKEIKRAHRCFDALVAGRVGSVAELATIEGVSDRYVSSLLPLAFLAPEIVDAIVSGTQPADLTTHRLIRRLELPTEWAAQKQLLGFA